MEILNQTPFAADRLPLFDRDGAECMIAVLKASYELDFRSAPRVAPEQAPLNEADVYVGEPGASGLLAENEYGPPKPATDVFLTAHAVPARHGDRVVDVDFVAGDRRQSARVYGERHWLGTLGVYRASRPEPIERVPLLWENASGGSDTTPRSERHHSGAHDNPCGKGFRAKHSRISRLDSPVPNIVDLADNDRAVGFLPVAPSWWPRLGYAGTYDARWEREYCPLLPPDFDERFHLASPIGLWGETRFQGGEAVHVVGTRMEGPLHFEIPRLQVRATPRFRHTGHRLDLHLDTVHVDTDALRLTLLYRGQLPCHGRIDELESVRFEAEGPGVAA